MLPSDLQLMLKPDCKASVDVITEKYSGVRSASQHVSSCIASIFSGWFLPDSRPPHQAADFPHPVQVKVNLIQAAPIYLINCKMTHPGKQHST